MPSFLSINIFKTEVSVWNKRESFIECLNQTHLLLVQFVLIQKISIILFFIFPNESSPSEITSVNFPLLASTGFACLVV